MTARFVVLAASLLMLAAAPSSFAADEPGRYTITPAGDSFLRLDSATGALSSCSRKFGAWTCESVADDVLEFKQEIDRLKQETEELRKKLAKAEASLEGAGSAKEPLPAGPSFQLPGLALDEVTDFVNDMIRRLQNMVRDLKQHESERTL